MVPVGAATLGHVTFGLSRRDTIFPLLLLLVLPHSYSWPLVRLSDDDVYYMNGNIRCLRCPPGTFVEKDCMEPDTRGKCTNCHAGRTYSEHPTGINHCLTCTRCRDDQEEVSPCTTTKNTQCHCKKGTFCPPDHPCEICLTCTTSCPPDQIIKAPCNSTSDTECSLPDSSSDRNAAIIWVAATIIPIIIGIGICFTYYCVVRKRTSATKCKLWSKRLMMYSRKPDETADGTNLLYTDTQLVFREGVTADQRETITIKSMDIFVDKVPSEEFEKFMRQLGLNPNNIYHAKHDNHGNTGQQHFAMLNKLRQEHHYDVNDLLKTLRTIKMGSVADEIMDQLIKDELYMRQTQS